MIRLISSLCFAGLLFLSGCSAPSGKGAAVATDAPASSESAQNSANGIATYLSDEFHGQTMASGAPYDKDAMVAAHPTLPFETEVRVTNLANDKSVLVLILDRIPERVESIIDVSSAAADELGMLESGEAEVVIEWFEE